MVRTPEKFFLASPDPVISQFGAELETIYFAHDHADFGAMQLAAIKLPAFANIKKLVRAGLKSVFDGFKGLIEPSLFRATYQTLNAAIDEGMGRIGYDKTNPAFATQLKKSGAWFAGRKSYQQTKELAALLDDGNGKVRSWRDFKALSKSVSANYNETWLKVEYNTAIASARNASRWKQFEADRDLYPNLVYTASRAATPRDEHKPYYGVIRPIDDDFWVKHYPPSAFNCMCGVDQTDDDETPVPGTGPEPAPGLDHNPGATGELFSRSHPYSADLTDDQLREIDDESERLADETDD